jgi:esterase/lipase superfamily enzyme
MRRDEESRKIYAYNYDRDSANYSRDALETLLRDLDENPQVRTITISRIRWAIG